jgi:hypothetical protein
MTSFAWACDSTPQAAAKSACHVATAKAKTQAATTSTCSSKATTSASCCAAMAATQANATAPAAEVETLAPAEAGMRVYRDPETGELTSTPSAADLEAAKDADLRAETLRDPVQTVMPDGSVMMELNGHGQEYFMMSVDKDGNRTTECVQDPKAAAKAPAVAPKPEDK